MTARHAIRHRALVAAIVAATALSACSSTNKKSSDESKGLEVVESPSASPSALLDVDGTPLTKEEIIEKVKTGELPRSALASASSAPSSQSSGGTAARPAGGSTPGPTKAGTVKPGPVGPGVTDKEIKIGISTFKLGDFAKNLGVNVDVGDNEAQAYAVINYVNKNGGIAGRKVVPSFFEVDFTTTGGTDGAFEAAACEQWTEDDKVFAAINLSLQRQQLLACLAKKDVLGVHNGMQIDEARMAPNRQWYYTTMAGSSVVHDRAAHTENKFLCGRGWYKGATVGIIYFDEAPLRKVVDDIYEKGILACGGKKVVKQAAGRGLTTADSTYVSRFQAEGVTNVMFLGEGGSYAYTFMPAAENQLYRPKYALRSDHAPAIQLAAAQVPPEQLRNAIGYGVSPMQDTDNAGDPGPTNSADRLCLEIFKNASISVADRGARLAAMSFCSGLLFLKQAIDQAPTVTSAGVAGVVKGLGTSFIPPAGFTCRFSSTQHDCLSSYREFAYNFEAKAFRYTSGLKPMATS